MFTIKSKMNDLFEKIKAMNSAMMLMREEISLFKTGYVLTLKYDAKNNKTKKILIKSEKQNFEEYLNKISKLIQLEDEYSLLMRKIYVNALKQENIEYLMKNINEMHFKIKMNS